MDSITLKAPAKVNLFLEILKKRNDGYHDIVTVFERINICDNITISKKNHRTIKVYCNGNIPEKENLAYKAAHLLLLNRALNRGVDIRIKKSIPIASGMGGGSSDAAATLIGINKLFKLGYKKEDLIKLAKPIGADVPFFVLQSSFAIGKDRGDNVKNLTFKPSPMWHLVMYARVKKSTKAIYNALRLNLTRKPRSIKMLLHALKIGDFKLIKRATYNCLENPALHRDKKLSALKSDLIRLGMKGALLAGSGPSIFCIMKTRKEAVLLKEKILRTIGVKAEGWQIFVARTL